VKKLFKKIDATAELTRVTDVLHQILSSDPDIKDVVWTDVHTSPDHCANFQFASVNGTSWGEHAGIETEEFDMDHSGIEGGVRSKKRSN
jgi:uncharacterized protein YuzB (UPF0349 family)